MKRSTNVCLSSMYNLYTQEVQILTAGTLVQYKVSNQNEMRYKTDGLFWCCVRLC